MFKKIIQKRLESLVKKYLREHKPKLVVVAGSVGKTGAKFAIATVLGERLRVRMQEGDYNSQLSVPLDILGITYPENTRSIAAWWSVLRAARARIHGPHDTDVIVQELGTSRPGDMASYGNYLRPDIAVVTAVSEERMESFSTLDAAAREELLVASFSGLTIVNRDDVDNTYARYAQTSNIDTYGIDEPAEYRVVLEPASPLDGRIGKLITPEWGEVPITLQLVGAQTIKHAAVAAAVGAKLGLTSGQVAVGISKLTPIPGRMQLLRGLKDSILIDDTYSSSPLPARAALETLYEIEAPQRIAILGSMNELGAMSAQAHEKIGSLCDPQKLAWVVTIGAEANQYLAPAATKQGCQVRSFDSPYAAGGFVHSVLEDHAVVLAKGSQDHMFTEEALKVLLHNTEEEKRLVRQSPSWLALKSEQFEKPVADD